MVIGSKFQLRSLNLDDFAISVNADKLQLVEQAKYLGLWVRNDLSWDDHILELYRKVYHYIHMFRRLRKILPSKLLLNIYKSYVQSKIDYGLSIWGCTTEANLVRIQRIKNLLARIMCNNLDYIIFRGIEIVRILRLQTLRGRRAYFLCILMFKCIHGLAPNYLCNDVTMYDDINRYDTRNAENMDLYLLRCWREIYKRSFLYKGSSLWNQLPSCVKESTGMIDFKRNYRLLYGWRLSSLLMPFMWTFYILYETSSCWQHIMSVFQLVIFIFIRHSFLYHLLNIYIYIPVFCTDLNLYNPKIHSFANNGLYNNIPIS